MIIKNHLLAVFFLSFAILALPDVGIASPKSRGHQGTLSR